MKQKKLVQLKARFSVSFSIATHCHLILLIKLTYLQSASILILFSTLDISHVVAFQVVISYALEVEKLGPA